MLGGLRLPNTSAIPKTAADPTDHLARARRQRIARLLATGAIRAAEAAARKKRADGSEVAGTATYPRVNGGSDDVD